MLKPENWKCKKALNLKNLRNQDPGFETLYSTVQVDYFDVPIKKCSLGN